MSAVDDRPWAEIAADLGGEGSSVLPNTRATAEVVVAEGQQVTPEEAAWPAEQAKSKNKQKGKRNKQVVFLTPLTAQPQQQPSAQIPASQPANPQSDTEQAQVAPSERQAQPGEDGLERADKAQEQPQETTTNSTQQAIATKMYGPFQPPLLQPPPIQPSLAQPKICGINIVPRTVHGKTAMYFERPHYFPPEKFKATKKGCRSMIPPLQSLLPCYAGYGQQPLLSVPGFMPQPFQTQQQYPPQQQQQALQQDRQPPPIQASAPAKASSVASSNSSKAASKGSVKEKKGKEEERDQEQKEDAVTSPAPSAVVMAALPTTPLPPPSSPVTINTYTCLLYTSPSPRDGLLSRMPSSA